MWYLWNETILLKSFLRKSKTIANTKKMLTSSENADEIKYLWQGYCPAKYHDFFISLNGLELSSRFLFLSMKRLKKKHQKELHCYGSSNNPITITRDFQSYFGEKSIKLSYFVTNWLKTVRRKEKFPNNENKCNSIK